MTRADEFVSQALVLDPTNAGAHGVEGWILREQGRLEEAIAEQERALDLNPADVGAMEGLGWDYLFLGQYEQGLGIFRQGDSAQAARSGLLALCVSGNRRPISG